MKTRIKQKLRSQCGATILMAMLFLLLCATVGAVVITSATANTNKVTGREQMQKEYMALSSAIRLVEDLMDGKSCEGIESETIYKCSSANLSEGTPHGDILLWEKNMSMAERDEQLQKYIEDLADIFLKESAKYHAKPSGEASRTTEFEIQGESMELVQVSMVMKSDYSMIFTLSVIDSPYQAILEFGATKTEHEGITDEGQCTHSVYVTVDGRQEEEKKSFPITKKTNTTQVTWSKKNLLKGKTE